MKKEEEGSSKILKDFRNNYYVSREKQADMLGIKIDTLNTWEYRNKIIPKMKLIHVERVFNTFKKELKDSLIKEEPLKVKASSFINYNIEEKLNVIYELLGTLVEDIKNIKEEVDKNKKNH